jgi:formate C-acetyltransferase
LLLTASYKETESQPAITRRAKALEKILNEIPIIIRDEELVVGSLTIDQDLHKYSLNFLING